MYTTNRKFTRVQLLSHKIRQSKQLFQPINLSPPVPIFKIYIYINNVTELKCLHTITIEKDPHNLKNKQKSPPQNQYSRLTFILSMMLLVPSTLYFLSRLPMECFSAQKVLPAPGRPTIMMICRQSTQHWHTRDTVIPTFINSFTNTTPLSTSGRATKTAHVAVVKWKVFQESKSVRPFGEWNVTP